MSTAAIGAMLVAFALSYWIGSLTGCRRGRKIGRDEGWNERECARLNDEHRRNYARRGRDGKFNGGAR